MGWGETFPGWHNMWVAEAGLEPRSEGSRSGCVHLNALQPLSCSVTWKRSWQIKMPLSFPIRAHSGEKDLDVNADSPFIAMLLTQRQNMVRPFFSFSKTFVTSKVWKGSQSNKFMCMTMTQGIPFAIVWPWASNDRSLDSKTLRSLPALVWCVDGKPPSFSTAPLTCECLLVDRCVNDDSK